MPFQPSRRGLHFEILGLTATEDSSRSFLMTKQILKSSLNCESCSSPMVLTPCAASKSADLFIWRCRPCKKTKNIRIGSVLHGSKLSFQHSLLLFTFPRSPLQTWRSLPTLVSHRREWRSSQYEKVCGFQDMFCHQEQAGTVFSGSQSKNFEMKSTSRGIKWHND